MYRSCLYTLRLTRVSVLCIASILRFMSVCALPQWPHAGLWHRDGIGSLYVVSGNQYGLSGTEGVMTLRITLLRYKSFALIILYTFSQWDLTYVISYSPGPWLKVAFYPLKMCKCKSHFLLHGYCLFFFWQSYEVGDKKYPFMKRYFFSCDNVRYFAVWFTA